MADEAWPVVLLALRAVVVVVLYLFLLSGFRTLRAELRAPAIQITVPPVAVPPERTPLEVAAPAAAPAPAVPAAPRRRATRTRRRIPLALGIPAGAAVFVVVLGAAALATRAPGTVAPGEVADAPANETFGPPVVKPASGHVTVGLAAQEDSLVRVTVDSVVQFDGTLRARQRQSWDGTQRVQVWTDKGKTLLIAINGDSLGPYSPAMGHAEWNRIDFGFIPGWTR